MEWSHFLFTEKSVPAEHLGFLKHLRVVGRASCGPLHPCLISIQRSGAEKGRGEGNVEVMKLGRQNVLVLNFHSKVHPLSSPSPLSHLSVGLLLCVRGF